MVKEDLEELKQFVFPGDRKHKSYRSTHANAVETSQYSEYERRVEH
jgi:hypothetical protein